MDKIKLTFLSLVKIKQKCQEMETEIMQYDEQLNKIEESIPKQ